MRITIIGQPASGKSTLARNISKKFSIPHIHLDQLWFEAGGRQSALATPQVEAVRVIVREKVREAIQQGSWVSDGLYSHIQPAICDRADTIVLIVIPLWERLRNHASRLMRPHERHKQLSRWRDLTFFIELIRRSYTTEPKLQKIVGKYKNKVIILHSRKEIQKYLESLK